MMCSIPMIYCGLALFWGIHIAVPFTQLITDVSFFPRFPINTFPFYLRARRICREIGQADNPTRHVLGKRSSGGGVLKVLMAASCSWMNAAFFWYLLEKVDCGLKDSFLQILVSRKVEYLSCQRLTILFLIGVGDFFFRFLQV